MRPILLALVLFPTTAFAQAPKAKPDSLDGPPFVSAKAWIAVDGATGKVLGGENQAEARPMASTSKIMTAWIVLRLTAAEPKVLDEVITFSERAAKTIGSSAKLEAGEKVTARELLYGLLLPSGNDAAVAFAEHFGGRFGKEADGDTLQRFVDEMNRRAKGLGLKEMRYQDPNGLSKENVSSVRDLATLAREAMKEELFRTVVATRRHDGAVLDPAGKQRTAAWTNTNKLLEIEGYEGVKTGTTTPAGNCLVASGKRGDDRVIVVVLGSTTPEGRYIDSRNIFRWAWNQKIVK